MIPRTDRHRTQCAIPVIRDGEVVMYRIELARRREEAFTAEELAWFRGPARG